MKTVENTRQICHFSLFINVYQLWSSIPNWSVRSNIFPASGTCGAQQYGLPFGFVFEQYGASEFVTQYTPLTLYQHGKQFMWKRDTNVRRTHVLCMHRKNGIDYTFWFYPLDYCTRSVHRFHRHFELRTVVFSSTRNLVPLKNNPNRPTSEKWVDNGLFIY